MGGEEDWGPRLLKYLDEEHRFRVEGSKSSAPDRDEFKGIWGDRGVEARAKNLGEKKERASDSGEVGGEEKVALDLIVREFGGTGRRQGI